ncbi:rhamnogalacturonan acetylesterase, partial [Vararia minispora EC-137]
MRLTGFLAAVTLAGSSVNAITLYLAGDSTMANDGGQPYKGWGTAVGNYLSISVVNNAVAGRSARSFTNEGRFSSMAAAVVSGDIVIIEFGHNDGGDPTTSALAPCFGPGTITTCQLTPIARNGTTVYTFEKYIEDAVNSFKAQGPRVIVSSQTPDNPFIVGTAPSRFVGYAQTSASDTGVAYVDHFDFVLREFEALGNATVSSFYPIDHLHTNTAGASIVAQAFVRGVLCAGSS